MHLFLDPQEQNKVVPIKTAVRVRDFSDIPVVQQAGYFLAECAKGPGIKLTQRGNLNRAFVQGFWRRFVANTSRFHFRPYKQEDCREVEKILFLLEELNLVTSNKKYLSLTPEGLLYTSSLSSSDLFFKLFEAYLDKFNWACEDRYPEFEFIQDHALYLLKNIIEDKSSEFFSSLDLFRYLFGDKGDFSRDPDDDVYMFRPEFEICHCINRRFVQQFCMLFGLVKIVPMEELLSIDVDFKFTKTDFLLDVLSEEIVISSR